MEALRYSVSEIRRKLRNGSSIKDIERMHPIFNNKYPRLFNMMMERYDDKEFMQILNKMIESMEQVHDGLYTQEEMDKKIGFDLARQFVYPNLDMTSETEAYEAERRMRESDDLEARVAKKDARHYEEIRIEQEKKEKELLFES